MMVINNVSITPVKPTPKGLLGFSSIEINNQLYLSSIAIYSRPNSDGIYLLYPRMKLVNGKEVNIFHPINRVSGKLIQDAVFEKYSEILDKC